MSQKTLIMVLLSPYGETGLSDAGRQLLRRLKAAGSPTTGQDAMYFAELLDNGELAAKYRLAMCEWLGYLPIGGYPLTRVDKEGGLLDREESNRGRPVRGGKEFSLRRKYETATIRARGAQSVDGKKEAPLPKRRRETHGLRGKPSNNPGGRPRAALDFDALPSGEWIGLSAASLLLACDYRTLQKRIKQGDVPQNVTVIEHPVTLLKRKDS